jgi:DNA-binding NtrC family response regulator
MDELAGAFPAGSADFASVPHGTAPEAPSVRGHVLAVGGDETLASELRSVLAQAGYYVGSARDAAAGLAVCAQRVPDAIVFDLACPNPIQQLQRLMRAQPLAPVIAVSPRQGAAAVQHAMAAGAHLMARSLVRESASLLLERALEIQRSDAALAHYRRREAQQSCLQHLVGESSPMLRLKTQLRLLLDAQAHRLASAPRLILLQGETGSGKSHVARLLHFDGARQDACFVRVDERVLCASDTELQLFGGTVAPTERRRGAQRSGLLRLAAGGTLYIRDIADLSLRSQARLAAWIERSAPALPGGVQVIAGSRCSVAALARAGRLQPELRRRFEALDLQLPPVRERGEDAVLLAQHFLRLQAERLGAAPPALSRSAWKVLDKHAWPGNVRELRHAVERACLLQSDGVIDDAHLTLPGASQGARALLPQGPHLQEIEHQALASALERTHGNISKAARLLGVSRDTMRYRIAKHRLGGCGQGWLPGRTT